MGTEQAPCWAERMLNWAAVRVRVCEARALERVTEQAATMGRACDSEGKEGHAGLGYRVGPGLE